VTEELDRLRAPLENKEDSIHALEAESAEAQGTVEQLKATLHTEEVGQLMDTGHTLFTTMRRYPKLNFSEQFLQQVFSYLSCSKLNFCKYCIITFKAS